MNTVRKRLAAGSSEDGSALVLALLVVLLVGALLAAVLDYARAGLTIAPAVKSDRNTSNYAQGAVEGAINEIRGSSQSGRTGVTCPDFVPPSVGEAGVDVGGQTFRVTCEGQAVQAVSPDGMAQPSFAIQQLAASPRRFFLSGNEELAVAGPVYGEGDFGASKTGGGADKLIMNVYGNVFFRGTCPSTTRVASPGGDAPRCNFTGTPSLGDDPQWPSSIPDQTSLDALITAQGADVVPTCNASQQTIDFSPGYYSVAPDLLAARYLTCTYRTWHFKPGFYYFDVDDTFDLGLARYPKGSTPSPVKVVGGTPGDDLTARPMGQGCKSSEDGVQFVLGGNTRIAVSGTAANAPQGLELCGPTSGQNSSYDPGFLQRIAMFGSASGTAAAAADVGTTTPTTVTSVGTAVDAGPARAIDGTSATFTSDKGSEVKLRLAGLQGTQPIPQGAKITGVRVRVKQAPAGTTPAGDINSTISLDIAGTAYPTIPAVQASPCSTTEPWCETTVYPSAGTAAPLWRDMSDARIDYAFKGPNGKIAEVAVDGFQVVVNWTVPTLRPLSQATCSDASCAFLATGTNARIRMHGTLYAPAGHLDVNVHNDTDTAFMRGVVVRTLGVNASASTKQDTAAFRLPSATGGGRRVLFKGYGKRPSQSERLLVRACVLYDDKITLPDGSTSGFPGYRATVARWSALRAPVDGNSCTGVVGP